MLLLSYLDKIGLSLTAEAGQYSRYHKIPSTLLCVNVGEGECITALAHPSSLFIGSTHGVYVMEQTG